MKSITTYITEKMVYTKATASKYKYHPETKEELQELLAQLIKERGPEGDFNDIYTSEITDMSELFCGIEDDDGVVIGNFNGDISQWDVSNVTNMYDMFYECESFNCDISNWNVSKVKDMCSMFENCLKFNQDISKWDVSNVENMYSMFKYSVAFNKPLNKWNVSNVEYMTEMFNGADSFNQDISKWKVSNLKDNEHMFDRCPIEEKFKPKFK